MCAIGSIAGVVAGPSATALTRTPLGPVFRGPQAGQRIQGCFGGAVAGHPGLAAVGDPVGEHVHDRAAAALRHHRGIGCGQQERCLDVDGEHGVQTSFGGLRGRGQFPETGIVDQNVDVPGLLNQPSHVVGNVQVGGDEAGSADCDGELLDHGVAASVPSRPVTITAAPLWANSFAASPPDTGCRAELVEDVFAAEFQPCSISAGSSASCC